MTFKDLKKRVVSETAVQQQQARLFQRLQGKPFWIWNIEEHKQEDVRTNGDCCFNHIIGLPGKDGVDKPLYDYQRMIYDCLVILNGNANSSNKHLWVKKATGLHIRVHASVHGPSIVTGPKIDLAIALIDRMKKLINRHHL